MVGKNHQRPFDFVENQSSHEELIRDVIEEVGGGFVPALSPAVFEQGANGGFAVGYEQSTGEVTSTGMGAVAHGFANGTGSTVLANGKGAFAGGASYGTIRASQYGAFAHGYTGTSTGSIVASSSGATAFGYTSGASSTIVASNSGAFASGYSYTGGDILASARGAAVFGRANNGELTASDNGAFVHGYSYGAAGKVLASGKGAFAGGIGYLAVVRATGPGAMAHGYSEGVGHYITAGGKGSFAGGCTGQLGSGNSILTASSYGGQFAFGYAVSGGVISTGHRGAVAFGFAKTNPITASGKGSAAFGYSVSASIVASGTNSFQFGPGTNALDNSISIGARGVGLRFCGSGVPASPENGDFWLESDTIKVRLGGVTKTVTVS